MDHQGPSLRLVTTEALNVGKSVLMVIERNESPRIARKSFGKKKFNIYLKITLYQAQL